MNMYSDSTEVGAQISIPKGNICTNFSVNPINIYEV